ncbi:hypothetical protein [Pseudofrankia sp. BMG5.36]|uniref:hypothetical protein n=1 Tax=Pseudofrankia sp. BMG5.36 TaxID=1834512 RepID=UPI0008D99BA4|nr:hypothetical protein [Pseudofrankia sp. BMG5.36]OHV58947.1 hypothetical protein BCD48_05950 [Pseudofrankia sp. BMG5.36]
MFGLELQASKNVFVKGVQDREVAYRHGSKLLTLEGDETLSGALSELEFVTAPVNSLARIREAVGFARDVAAELARLSPATWGKLTFEKGDTFVGGIWERDCTLQINDRTFVAKPQGTVGVPLAKLRSFVEEVLHSEGAAGAKYLESLAEIRAKSGLVFDQENPELTGFLTACHIFLLAAVWNFSPDRAVAPDGTPLIAKDGDFFRVFTFKDSAHLRTFEHLPPGSKVKEFSFYKADSGHCRVLVNRDSPKSSFTLLHRTDFHAMFDALPEDQKARLRTQPGHIPPALWPTDWPDRFLFPFAYRADPPDPQMVIPEYAAGGWPKDGVTRQETWQLIEHGPTISAWWDSVLNGRSAPGQQPDEPRIRKDLASPPPGLRGRRPDRIADFPGDDENKREYYGMGAFPMDRKDGPKPLAVFELRAFADHQEVMALGPPTLDTWVRIAEIFQTKFVPKA